MKIRKESWFQHLNWRSRDHYCNPSLLIFFLLLSQLPHFFSSTFRWPTASPLSARSHLCISWASQILTVFVYQGVFSVSWSFWLSKCLFGIIHNIRESICFIPALGHKIALVKTPSSLGAAGLGAAFRQELTNAQGCTQLSWLHWASSSGKFLNWNEKCYQIKETTSDEAQKGFFKCTSSKLIIQASNC